MSIMIIGGAGFIGSRICERLAGNGHNTVCFDMSAKPSFRKHADRIAVVQGDVTAIDQIIDVALKHKVERIIHMAAWLGADCEQRPHVSHVLNINGTNNVFEAARILQLKRVVYASSIAVYGPQSNFGDRPVNEGDHPDPVWIYGAQKLYNEAVGKKYLEKYGLETVGIRIASTYGGAREKSFAAYNSLMIAEPAKGRAISVPLRSSQLWPLIYIDDTADFFIRACLAPVPKFPVYLTGAETASMGDIAKIVVEQIPGAQISFDEKAPLLPNLYQVNGDLGAKEFSFSRRSLRDGIIATIAEARGQ